MSRKFIPVEEVFARRREDPAFVEADDALEDDFALASALIGAREHADVTQEQVARAMGTAQAVVARLEAGRTKPSTRTRLRFAAATRKACAAASSRKSRGARRRKSVRLSQVSHGHCAKAVVAVRKT